MTQKTAGTLSCFHSTIIMIMKIIVIWTDDLKKIEATSNECLSLFIVNLAYFLVN